MHTWNADMRKVASKLFEEMGVTGKPVHLMIDPETFLRTAREMGYSEDSIESMRRFIDSLPDGEDK